MSEISYHKKELQIQVVGHFDGYICGLLSSLRVFEILPSFNGTFKDGTLSTLYQCKDLKEFYFYKDKIQLKVKEYKEWNEMFKLIKSKYGTFNCEICGKTNIPLTTRIINPWNKKVYQRKILICKKCFKAEGYE